MWSLPALVKHHIYFSSLSSFYLCGQDSSKISIRNCLSRETSGTASSGKFPDAESRIFVSDELPSLPSFPCGNSQSNCSRNRSCEPRLEWGALISLMDKTLRHRNRSNGSQ